MSQMTQMVDERRDPQTYAIIGAGMEVHRHIGSGFLEAVYQEALSLEFRARAIPFTQQIDLPIHYKSTPLQCTYRADFVCFENVVVEIKALVHLGAAERAQLINYLKASGLNKGLLLNFGSGRLEYERFILTINPVSSVSSASSVDNLEIDG